MATSGSLHLIIGPVGAGKSTFARASVARHGGVFLDVDSWMVRLYGKDTRPAENVVGWYLERRQRVRELHWDTTLNILASGIDVFAEPGLVTTAERDTFYTKAQHEGLAITVYFVDAPRDVRRQRVARRNGSIDGYTQVVPMEFFERASDAWEPPSERERAAVQMIDVTTEWPSWP